ncbi:class I SAM-dependent methyltransferase [Pseudonocardia sp. S2-4]|uniref:Class I SAM-dependent methyltransferase n=2 Tax=Pseudonocardia humida TaxID=2800819 RepID=A0ABT1A8Q9_9PSEU|nr:class I SAM-dependent methyltransferase [Pseudonocardia humida]
MFTERAWEERYRATPAVWSGRPNPQLVAEAADLPVGRALDVGCGEGADAIWLAERGWPVTGVDFATAALERAAGHAAARGPEVAGRTTWVHADITGGWDPGDGVFDLVSAQFMQLPEEPRTMLFARLARAVAPGGTLLIVGHHFDDEHAADHPHLADMGYTAEEIAWSLDAERWEIVVAETRSRLGRLPGGSGETTLRDVVLRARRG